MYITGLNSDPTSCDDEIDDETDDDGNQISRKILIGRYRNLGDALQDLGDPILDTSGSRLNPSASEESTPYTLPASLSKNGEGGSKEENASKLKKDLFLAFKEQDKLMLALAPTPSSPRL